MKKLRLKTNNLTGFMEGSEFDGVVIDQPNARGRIQYQMTPTLNTSTVCGSGVIVRERERERVRNCMRRLRTWISRKNS